LPIIIPNNLKYFKYKKKKQKIIKLDYAFLKNKFFRIKNFKGIYDPIKIISSSGLEFSDSILGVLGVENKKIYQNIKKFNRISKIKIQLILKKYKKVCSFQTRNIPHFGHELIISRLLETFDHVIINPVIGPKKKGDVNYNILDKSFNFLIDKKYTKEKVSFIPILANMFYAGPFEAIHHANLRAALCLKHFVVGRDHAGAQNAYHPDAAFKLINKYKNKINIHVIALKGSYYCSNCKKVVIKGDCLHNSLLNISGTNFRKYLFKKKIFKHADYDMQIYLKKFDNLFTK